MKALITGGTGFIGAALGDAIRARGGRLVLLSRRGGGDAPAVDGVEHVAASVTDAPALRRAAEGCGWVFHLAAREDVVLERDRWGRGMFETNVLGTRTVLAAARDAGVRRVVVVTSVTTFGYAGDGVINDGSVPHDTAWFESVYVGSRVQQELQCLEAAAAGQDVVVCAPAGIVGPGDRKGSSATIEAFARGRLPVVPRGGFNWMAIGDVVAGLLAAAERGRKGRRYLFAHENLTYRDFLARVGALCGRAPPKVAVPSALLGAARCAVDLLGPLVGIRPGVGQWDRVLGERYFSSARLAVEEIGLPQTPIDDAIRATLEGPR